jgi:hypothetical protein
MADDLSTVTTNDLTAGRFVLRVAWIAARLMMGFYLGSADSFFYQGF